MKPCFEERPVFFPGPRETLAGVLTLPHKCNSLTVLQIWGTAPHPSSGMNRLRARFAHVLAEDGFASLRFDWPGQGESGGSLKGGDLSTSYVRECVSAVSWLREQGHRRLLVLGHCFGGRSAILAAPALGDLEGVAVISPPTAQSHEQAIASQISFRTLVRAAVEIKPKELADREWREQRIKVIKGKLRSHLPGGATTMARESSPSVAGVRQLLDQRTPVLILTHEGSDFRTELEQFLEGNGLSDEMASVTPSRFVVLDYTVRGNGSLPLQDELVSQVRSWLAELPVVMESTAQ